MVNPLGPAVPSDCCRLSPVGPRPSAGPGRTPVVCPAAPGSPDRRRGMGPTPRTGYHDGSRGRRTGTGEPTMTRNECTEAILAAKQSRGITWRSIADALGRHVVWATAALLGQATMDRAEAEKAA